MGGCGTWRYAAVHPERLAAAHSYPNCCCFRRPLVIDRFLWRDDPAGANRRDPSLSPEFQGGVTPNRSPSEAMAPTPAQPASSAPEELPPTDLSPRADVVASLASTLSRAVALGDEAAARVVHEAIGRLLGLPPAPRR
ncbi:hypothetical protein [Sorangium sp. So ce341]|uniref:hypothetical protein n=1 Tax=Sorangium sp. So ce341 TaxID=3133302 RepID=UPI003F601D57